MSKKSRKGAARKREDSKRVGGEKNILSRGSSCLGGGQKKTSAMKENTRDLKNVLRSHLIKGGVKGENIVALHRSMGGKKFNEQLFSRRGSIWVVQEKIKAATPKKATGTK